MIEYKQSNLETFALIILVVKHSVGTDDLRIRLLSMVMCKEQICLYFLFVFNKTLALNDNALNSFV